MDEIIIVAVCLFLNALFSAFEMAFVSVPRPELRAAARKGNRAAQRLLNRRENPERTLSIIQVGITLVGAVAAAVGGAGASENLEPYLREVYGVNEITAEVLSVVGVVAPITYLSVVIGELVPKTLALRNPMRIVLWGSRPLFIADQVLSPVVTTLEWSTKKILNLFFRRANKAPAADAVPASIEIDAFSPVHQTLMMNMAGIEKKRVKDILIPWDQVNFVRSLDTVEQVYQVVLSSGHTRLPVTDDGKIVGILHTKEFVALKDSGETNWLPIVRPALKVMPTDAVLGVLRLMQEKRNHMTVVFNSHGLRLGLVTLEDILEEVVGDIYDEDDDGKVRRIFANKGKNRGLRPPR